MSFSLNISSERTIHYLDQGEGFPLLFGHSFLWNREMWRPQIEALSTRYRCIVPDLWGHGESSTLQVSEYSTTRLADDYLEFTAALNLEEFAIIGLSVGGMWAMELALKAPEKVKALVMADTFVGAEPEPTKLQYFGMLEMIESIGTVPEPLADQIMPMFFSPTTLQSDSQLPAAFKAMLLDIEGERLQTIVTLGRAIFGRPERLVALQDVACPLLVLCGQDDIPRPSSEAQRMAELAGVPLVLIADGGHICNLEQPDAVNQALLRFLKESL